MPFINIYKTGSSKLTLMEMLFLLYHANLRKAKLEFSLQKNSRESSLNFHDCRIGYCAKLEFSGYTIFHFR